MTYDEINEKLVFFSSYELMGAITNLAKQIGPSELWLRILGENWPSCDNIFAYQSILKRNMMLSRKNENSEQMVSIILR